MAKIDTSMDGFRYIGINLTEEQYDELVSLNVILMDEKRKDIPVFNTMVLLKELGLLSDSMIDIKHQKILEELKNTDYKKYLERKTGRRKP